MAPVREDMRDALPYGLRALPLDLALRHLRAALLPPLLLAVEQLLELAAVAYPRRDGAGDGVVGDVDADERRGAAEAKNNAESLIHSTEKQLAEHGDKVSAEVKGEIEKALAEAKTAVESGDADEMQQKTATLTQAAMKLGQAMYEQSQAQAQQTGGEAGEGTAEKKPGEEEVVDAEFSEVDEGENKG